MRRLASIGVVAVAATLAAAGSASAAPFDEACPDYGGVRICSASVPSFDGSPLDVDVTLPSGGGRHPLIVMLHGFGNNKHEWGSRSPTRATARTSTTGTTAGSRATAT